MGKHILIDLKCFDKEFMDSEERVSKLLNELVTLIDMRKLGEQKYRGAEWITGTTCIIAIETSHISMHTYSGRDKIAFDLYSCKDYDENLVKKHIFERIKDCEIINETKLRRYDE